MEIYDGIMWYLIYLLYQQGIISIDYYHLHFLRWFPNFVIYVFYISRN